MQHSLDALMGEPDADDGAHLMDAADAAVRAKAQKVRLVQAITAAMHRSEEDAGEVLAVGKLHVLPGHCWRGKFGPRRS